LPHSNGWTSQLPPLGNFVLSPGFGGCLVLLAAVAVFLATSRRVNKQLSQQDKHHQELRADAIRREAVERCWERLVWLIKTAGAETADRDADEGSLGLGPQLTLAIIEGLNRDAKELADDTLAEATAIYLTQYGLVLGQRIGSLPATLPESNGHLAQRIEEGSEVPAAMNSADSKSRTSAEGRQ
jgi:hypothetical protein